MTYHYSVRPCNMHLSVRARAVDVRTHFKNMREVCAAIKGMSLVRAKKYLRNVIAQREIVPFRRFTGCVGRKAQVKNFDLATQGRWPKKSCEVMLGLLQNAQANAVAKQLDLNRLFVSHVCAERAPKTRRRTYRAHGSITPYMANPSHVELVLTQCEKAVKKPSAPTKASAQ